MFGLNPYLVLGFIAALLASFAAGGALGWHEKEIRVPALLEAQQTADHEACAKVQQLTKDANDALQKDRNDIARKLAAYKLRQRPPVMPVTSAANISAGGPQHAGQNGAVITADTLRDYAAEAEQYRSELMVCTKVLDEERAPYAGQ